MSTVYTKFEPGREWIMHVTAVPMAATSIHDCTVKFVEHHSGGAHMRLGDLLIECRRNDKGVQALIVLPNGYGFPTGRLAPKNTWFPMMKAHMRSWLAMTPTGRVVRIVNEGVRALKAQFEAGNLDEDRYLRSSAKLEEFRAGALGELPPHVSEADLLAGFYNWVTEAAAQSKLPQRDVLSIIDRAIRGGKTVQVPDLEDDVLGKDFQRFLDI